MRYRQTSIIFFQIREYLKTPQAKLKLTAGWGKSEAELPDLHVCAGGWDWVKRHIDSAIDSRLIDLLEDWEKVERCIPELETKLCRDAKLDLYELESELSNIENDVQDDAASTCYGSVLLARSNTSVTDLTQMVELSDPEETLPRKIINVVGKLLKPFSPDKKGEKKLQKYMKDGAGVAQKRAEKRLKNLQHDKEELQVFVNELMRRPFNYILKLEITIPKMIESNEMLLSKYEQDIIREVSSRNQYIEMMAKIESIRRGLLEYGESYLYANDYEEEDVQLLNAGSNKQMVRSDSLKDVLRRGSLSEEMESLQYPHGLWTASMKL